MKLRVVPNSANVLPVDPNIGITLTPKGDGGGSGGGDGCVLCFDSLEISGSVTKDETPRPGDQITLNFDPTGSWSAVVTAKGEFCGRRLRWRVEHHYKPDADDPTQIESGGGKTIQISGDEQHVKGMTYLQLYVDDGGCEFPLGPRVLIKDENIDENCQFCFGGFEVTGDLTTPVNADSPGIQFTTHTATGGWDGAIIADLVLCDMEYEWHHRQSELDEPITFTEDLDELGRPRLNMNGADAELNGSAVVWLTVQRNELLVGGDTLCEFQVGPVLYVNPVDTCSSEFTEEVWYPQDSFFEAFSDFFAFGDYDIEVPTPAPFDTSTVEYWLPVTDADFVCPETAGRMSTSVEWTGGTDVSLEVFFEADFCNFGSQPAIKMTVVVSGSTDPAPGSTFLISVYYDHPTLGPTLIGGDVVGVITV